MLSAAILILLQPRPTEIVFTRHAETVANATGRYNSQTLNALSEKGQQQVVRLTGELAKLRFDAIVVSPSPRALKTVAPYLRRTGQRAEIWPELLECCDARTRRIKGVTSPAIRYGEKVRIPSDFTGLFTLPSGKDRSIVATSYEDGLRQIRLSAARIKSSFGGRGKTVLVVGHSIHGGRLLDILAGRPLKRKIENAKLIRLRETAGNFLPAGT